MTYNETRPLLLDTGNGLGDRFATTPSTSEHRAIAPSRQVFWLARRARISLEHAAALAEANKLGGAA